MGVSGSTISNFRLQKSSGICPLGILMLVVVLIICGCQNSVDKDSDIELDWQIEPEPPKVGEALIQITLRDSTEQLITDAEIELEGNMSHPGMEPLMATASEVAPGYYEAPVTFTMAGEWFILVQATLARSEGAHV